jgi:hypothetical protein
MVKDPARLIACKTAMQRLIERIGTPFSNAELPEFPDTRTGPMTGEVKNGVAKMGRRAHMTIKSASIEHYSGHQNQIQHFKS